MSKVFSRIIFLFLTYQVGQFIFSKKRGLGLTDNSTRKLESGEEYDYCFPEPANKTQAIENKTSIDHTLELINDVIAKTKAQTQKIAYLLRGKDRAETLRNVFEFTVKHIGYRMDASGKEQVRTPARSWYDRSKGIDCDCFTVFIGSILENLNIPYKKRVTAYGKEFQHIYIVAINNGTEIPLDPVIGIFNYEKPYTVKKDYE